MNKEQVNKLLKKYEQGLTNSEEEASLVEQLGNSRSESHAWFQYIKKHKKQAPANLENDIWDVIQSERKGKIRKLFRIASIAATVVLFISILWITKAQQENEMSYDDKVATLNEALSMISHTDWNLVSQNILYEDEMIIIYTE